MTLAARLVDVGKTYPHFHLSDIHLQIPHGTIMGLIGPNGAGKSTTLRILMGLIHQDRGDVELIGHPMPERQVEAKWQVGFMSEDMCLYRHAPLRRHMDFIGSIYPSWDSKYAEKLLASFDLKAEQKIGKMSHGQRIKAVLLLVLARRPKLLILDEPTTGLDPVARREVLDELMEVLMDEDRTILFSSHNTLDVEQISDRITFIDRGRIIHSRDKETFLDSWRRIRVQLPAGAEPPKIPGLVEVRHSRHLAELVTNEFEASLPELCQNAGARVHRAERMSLEEIFVSAVHGSRQPEKARCQS